MVFSLLPSLAGCSSGDVSSKGVVKPNSKTTIGNAKRNGAELIIPAGTFENTVYVSIDKAGEETFSQISGASFLSEPLQFAADSGESILGETVTVKIKLPESFGEDDYLTVMGAYYDGENWEYILPSFEPLTKGYLEFGTPHFSIFAPVQLEKDKALEQYAKTLAVQNVTGQQTQDDQSLADEVNKCFNETLESMGFTDSTVQGVIMQKIAKENVIGGIVTNIKNGDIADLSGQASEYIADAIIKSLGEKGFKENLSAIAGGVGSGAVAAAIELYESGDYSKAYKEFVYSAMDFLPAARLGKAVVEATKAGVEMWQDYSVEYAYKVYLDQKISPDGLITNDSWDMVFHNMGSGLTSLQIQYRTAYAAANGKTLKEIDKDKTLKEKLNNAVLNDVKRKFIRRYTQNAEIEAEKTRIESLLALFDSYGLLDPDCILKFSHHISLTDRINSLMKIRQNIIDIAGGDLSVFGNSEKKIEDNLVFAVKMWLLYGKDRAGLYGWMREQGYLEKTAEIREGYWQFVRSFESDYITYDDSNPNYISAWSGGNGTYTFNCKFIGHYSYIGSTHDDCHGEFVNNTAIASIPKDRYYGGETVVIDLTVSAETSSNICLHLGASLEAYITPVNKDNAFASYGTDITLCDITGEHTKSFINTYKNDTNTGYLGMSVTVSGVMPKGYKDGDKIYIITGMGAGNQSVETAYEYKWHSP